MGPRGFSWGRQHACFLRTYRLRFGIQSCEQLEDVLTLLQSGRNVQVPSDTSSCSSKLLLS